MTPTEQPKPAPQVDLHDTATTALGAVLGGLGATTVDYSKVATGDKGELVKLGLCFGAMLFGYFSNKKKAAKQ